MKLTLEGNKASYQQSQHITYGEISLEKGINNPATVTVNDIKILFNDSKVFQDFIRRLKGAPPTNISLILSQLHLINNLNDVIVFSEKSFTELNMFKAIFLVYEWVEIAYTDVYAVNLSSKIYDEFIVDFNNTPGPQEDIYFIKRELINKSNYLPLKRLVDINLLLSVKFNGSNLGTHEAYLIPLDKPGVKREDFKYQLDPTGNITYNLWKNILRDRDTRISNWFKKRY